MTPPAPRRLKVATDVGGTFTDLVYAEWDEATAAFGPPHSAKVHTTPPDFERGILDVLARADLDPADIMSLAHGTTVVINALSERKGARTGLVTTRGFRDVLEIARGNRPDLYNFTYAKPEPFVPRFLRQEVTERIDYHGAVQTPLRLDELPAILAGFRAEGVEAIAVCLLYAFLNPEHEVAVAAELRRLWPEIPVVSSHEITREWREYERTSTTVLAAYVSPVTRRYVGRLQAALSARRFAGQLLLMQSNGGVDTAEAAMARPISMVESGPASGMLGAAALGRLIGIDNVIALDIGGTTAKCSLVDRGQVRITTEYMIERTRTTAGYPIMAPVVDLVEIGNGGGSIGWIDANGRLRVGPRSAGAAPGPAAYGKGGTDATTTDANLLLGRIDPANLLGGAIHADMEAVRRAFAQLGSGLDVSPIEAARGMVRIANANMTNALKLVSLNRGYDPRDFTLMAFGGGGAMHACALAPELGIRSVVVPVESAVFSALGMMLSDLRRDYVQSRPARLAAENAEAVATTFAAMESEAVAAFARDGIAGDRIILERYGNMRYQGQEFTVRTLFPAGAVEAETILRAESAFRDQYEREYGYRLDNAVELVTFHVIATALVDKPRLRALPVTGRGLAECRRGERKVDFDLAGSHATPTYARDLLEPGMSVSGPAIIEEPATTTVVPPGDRVTVDRYGNLHIAIAGGAS